MDFNRYAYSGNDPINKSDPLGHTTFQGGNYADGTPGRLADVRDSWGHSGMFGGSYGSDGKGNVKAQNFFSKYGGPEFIGVYNGLGGFGVVATSGRLSASGVPTFQGPLPPSYIAAPGFCCFQTLDLAILAVHKVIQELYKVNNFEFSSFVYDKYIDEFGRVYGYTRVVTNGMYSTVDAWANTNFPDDAQSIVAHVHNHPDSTTAGLIRGWAASDMPSSDDVGFWDALNREYPGFIGVISRPGYMNTMDVEEPYGNETHPEYPFGQ